MRIDLTSKLKDNEDPVITIGDMEVTVKTNASDVLQLMGVISEENNNIKKMEKAQEILFSDADKQKILKLPFYNWATFMEYAIQLAANGRIIEEEESEEEGELTNPTTT